MSNNNSPVESHLASVVVGVSDQASSPTKASSLPIEPDNRRKTGIFSRLTFAKKEGNQSPKQRKTLFFKDSLNSSSSAVSTESKKTDTTSSTDNDGQLSSISRLNSFEQEEAEKWRAKAQLKNSLLFSSSSLSLNNNTGSFYEDHGSLDVDEWGMLSNDAMASSWIDESIDSDSKFVNNNNSNNNSNNSKRKLFSNDMNHHDDNSDNDEDEDDDISVDRYNHGFEDEDDFSQMNDDQSRASKLTTGYRGDKNNMDQARDYLLNDHSSSSSSTLNKGSHLRNSVESLFESELERMKQKFDDITVVREVSRFLSDHAPCKVIDFQVQTLENGHEKFCLIIGSDSDETTIVDRVYILEPNADSKSERMRVYKCNLSKNLTLHRCYFNPNGSCLFVTSKMIENENVSNNSTASVDNFYLSTSESATVPKQSTTTHITHKIDAITEQITSIGWNSRCYSSENAPSAQPLHVLIGTSRMNIFHTVVKDIQDSKGPNVVISSRRVLDLKKFYVSDNMLSDRSKPLSIAGIECAYYTVGAARQNVIIVTTNIGVSIFNASGVTYSQMDQVLQSYQNPLNGELKRKPLSKYFTGDTDEFNSQLCVVRKSDILNEREDTLVERDSDMPISFAWSTTLGVFHGKWYAEISDILEKATMIPYEDSDIELPLSITATELHIFVMYHDHFHIYMQPAELPTCSDQPYNILSKIVYDSTEDYGFNCDSFIRLVSDTTDYGTSIYIVSNSEVTLLSIEEETLGFWNLFLQQAQYATDYADKLDLLDKALFLCDSIAHIDEIEAVKHKSTVYREIGQYFLTCPNHLQQAARYLAKTNVPFDQTVLDILQTDPDDVQSGLFTYLNCILKKIKSLPHQNTIDVIRQKVSIALWIAQLLVQKRLYCDIVLQQSSATFSSNQQKSELMISKKQAIKDMEECANTLRKFLFKNKDTLLPCKEAVYSLLTNNLLSQDFLFFATLVGDYQVAIEQCITNGRLDLDMGNSETEHFQRALWILNEFCIDQEYEELWYKYSPLLMNYHSNELFKALNDHRFLQPDRLVPALLQYSKSNHKSRTNKRNDLSIKYLTKCIDNDMSNHSIIHNLLFYLLVQSGNSSKVDSFLRQEQEKEVTTLDKEFALRLCTEAEMQSSCTILYVMMGLYEQAIDIAIKQNQNQEAIHIVVNHIHDQSTRRKMLLKILSASISNDPIHLKQSLSMISSDDFVSTITLTDVLEVFPQDIHLHPYEENIREVLQTLKLSENKLKDNIKELAESTNTIRNDLNGVKMSRDIHDQKCSHCRCSVLSDSFMVFPCSHAFHRKCLIEIHATNIRQTKSNILTRAKTKAENRFRKQEAKKKRKRMKEEQTKYMQALASGEDVDVDELQEIIEEIEREPVRQPKLSELDITFTKEQMKQLSEINNELSEIDQYASIVEHIHEDAISKSFFAKLSAECPLDGHATIEDIRTPIVPTDEGVITQLKGSPWEIVHNKNITIVDYSDK